MKKYIIGIIFILVAQVAKTCVCHPEIFDNYIRADFIGEVKILKVYKNESPDYHHYRIDVEPRTVYKGEKQNVLYVFGSNIENNWTSCDLTVYENETWLVYTTKDTRGNFTFGMCTKSHKTSFSHYDSLVYNAKGLANFFDHFKREVNFLTKLKKYKDIFDKPHLIHSSSSSIPGMYQYLQTFNGLTFDNDLGFYKIIFNEDFSIKKVVVVKSFGRSFDKKLVDYIKKQDFTFLIRIKMKFSNDSYIPLFIQFYKKEKFLAHILV